MPETMSAPKWYCVCCYIRNMAISGLCGFQYKISDFDIIMSMLRKYKKKEEPL